MRGLIRSVLLLSAVSVLVPATSRPVYAAAEQRRTVTQLPYRFPQADAFGNVWMVYHGGRLMQQGNMPFSSDSGQFTINGQGVNTPGQQAVIDSNGEIVLENMRSGTFTITRRVAQGPDGGIRVCDIIRNTRGQDAQANLSISFNVNFGVQSSRPLSDPRKADRTIANIITDGQNRTGIDVFGGRGTKVSPTINAQLNSSLVQIAFDLKVPANKEVAVVHFHSVFAGQDQAEKFFATAREAKALAGLTPEIRKLVVNYPSNAGMFDDMEVLRGGMSDVVELGNGDQLRGSLLQQTWELTTSFGKIQVPAEQVAGLMVPAGLQQRHLLITTDGEIIGGQLSSPNIDLQLSSGQKVSLPLNQVTRIGRKSPGTEEPEARPNVPMLYLRSGDRLAIKVPAEPLKIATRFGTLAIRPDTLSNLDLQPEGTPAHMITLNDGSRFSGLLLAEALNCELSRGGKVSFPVAALRRIVLAGEAAEASDPPSSVTLSGDDQLAVTLSGKLNFITSYGQVQVNAPEIKRITRVKNTIEDVQVTLWDDSVLSGRLSEPYLQFAIAGGAQARVPVGLIEQYLCPAPQPSSGIVERINKLVTDLNADDWKQREKAEADLLAIGQPVTGILRQVRAAQPPEAQQRIDSILKQLTKGSSTPESGPAAAPPMFNR